MRRWNDEKGERMLFLLIYIFYIYIIFPLHHFHSPSPSPPRACLCSAEDAPQGRKGERWWRKKIGWVEEEWWLRGDEVGWEVVEVGFWKWLRLKGVVEEKNGGSG